MPTTQKPPAARGGRRGKHREKRLKMLEAKPHWLANDAPYGEYLVDTVALQLFRGAAVSHLTRMNSSGSFREDISLAARSLRCSSKNPPTLAAEKLRLTNNFLTISSTFSSASNEIKVLIGPRLLTSLNPNSMVKLKVSRGETCSTHWDVAAGTIQNYLDAYIADANEGGNYDWLTRVSLMRFLRSGAATYR